MTLRAFENDESAFAQGTVLMWYGSLNNVPRGWLVADGSNGTHQINGTFLQGATNDSHVGERQSDNLKRISTGQMPTHDHEGVTSTIGDHRHSETCGGAGSGNDGGSIINVSDSSRDNTTLPTSSDGNHRHEISLNYKGSGDLIDWQPPYITVMFIEKA